MVLSFAMTLLGVLFLVVGFMQGILGNTRFIADYKRCLQEKTIDQGFAKRLGYFELGLGSLYLVCGVVSWIVGEPFRLYSFLGCFVALVLLLSINQNICERNLKQER